MAPEDCFSNAFTFQNAMHAEAGKVITDQEETIPHHYINK